MASTVQELLDQLTAGKVGIDAVAADFAARTWPTPAATTDAQRWGVHDTDDPDPNSWAAVEACWALTPAQYRTLADARTKAN